ncbi:MAG TPA: histidine kinase [Blastocatellia bacterium]|nr:histidine kinase [Blastocatellia bacterium]
MLPNDLKDRLSSFWTLQLAGWLAYWVMIYITFLTVTPTDRMLYLLHVKTVRSVIGFALTSALRLVYKPAARRLSFRAIALLALSGSILLGCLWTTIEETYFWLLNPNLPFTYWLPRFPKSALDYAMTVLAWSALYFGIKYWQAWEAERERALRAAALAHQAQLEMLRYQLNPHFLFNALNSIRASIDEDSRRAKRMITEFSDFLRYSLSGSSTREIPLREEIEAIRSYLAIEKIRFEDRLDVTFDVEPAADGFRIPGFLIHPLVENAVKHGMSNGPSPLRIRITARAQNGSLSVEVANTGCWHLAPAHAESDPDHTGIGLSNVRQRLSQLFPGRSRFHLSEDDGWIRAVIEISKR